MASSPKRSPDRWRAAVLGSPVAHSLSPALHRAAYAELGLDWSYDAIECDERALPAVLDALAAETDPPVAGVSLTMPLKRVALPLVDSLDGTADAIGAVNTVLFGGGGRTGHNTDVTGLLQAIAEVGLPTLPVAAVVLGSGGAARAAIGALGRLGIGTATVLALHPSAAGALVEVGERAGVAVVVEPWDVAHTALAAAELVVSATPPGATDRLARERWNRATALVEVVYAPWPTRLAAAARHAGARVVGGLTMLVGQAAAQVELMTGRPAPVPAMRAAGEAALAEADDAHAVDQPD